VSRKFLQNFYSNCDFGGGRENNGGQKEEEEKLLMFSGP
jgi:hypothetical protein